MAGNVTYSLRFETQAIRAAIMSVLATKPGESWTSWQVYEKLAREKPEYFNQASKVNSNLVALRKAGFITERARTKQMGHQWVLPAIVVPISLDADTVEAWLDDDPDAGLVMGAM